MFIKRVTAVALAAFLLFSSVILQQVAAADTASLTAASAADSTLQPDVAEASNSTALPAEGAAKPDRATAGLTPLEKKLEPATVKEAANKPEVASNEEKKNNHYSPRTLPEKALQPRAAQIASNTPQALNDEQSQSKDIKKGSEEWAMTLQGCVAIADDAKSLVIIRPKNGAEEGIITCLDPGESISDEDVTQGKAKKEDKEKYDFFSARNDEAEQIKEVILKNPKYTLRFDKKIYFYKKITQLVDKHGNYAGPFSGNELDSLGNIDAVDVSFMTDSCGLLQGDKNIKDIRQLRSWKFQTNQDYPHANFASYFQGMESLTYYTDFSQWQSNFSGGIESMDYMFQGAGTDDFVLNFSNLKLYYPNSGGDKYFTTKLENTFAGFRGVLVANNWQVGVQYEKERRKKKKYYKEHYNLNALIASKNTRTANGKTDLINKSNPKKQHNLFGQTEEQTKEDYTLTNLVVTDNSDLLELGAKAKYYKEITITYKDKTETLQLPACYDSRVNENFETDTSKPASGDYMKIVKHQVDKAIQAKEQEMRQKYNIPADMQLFPTQKITFTPTSLFQNYKIDYPPADVQMEAQPPEQTVYEGQEINQIKITVTSQKEENLPTFAFDQAWQTELAKIGLKFTPAAPDPNNRKVLAAGTISGIIKDNSLQQELDSKGAKTYQITVTGKTTSGKEIKCEQTLKITVTRQIAVGNKPETSGKLSLYLVAVGLLSLLLFSGRKTVRN